MNAIVMSEDWFVDAAAVVGAGAVAHAFIQGYPFTCFARIGHRLELPPIWGGTPDWNQFFDVRVFGVSGEWHAWRLGGRWFDRTYSAGSWPDIVSRDYAMWGSDRDANAPAGWECLVEKRGARVWIPSGLVGATLPAILTMHLRVGQDGVTGMAGIVDAAITGVR